VESVVQAGRVRILGVTAKELGYPPYFEELGHTCANPLSHERYGEIARVVEAAHRALGIDYGATHAELRLGSDGPRMIEIAARLGGDKIPWVTGLATGVDLVALTIASLTGGQISVPRFGDRVAGIRMIYPDHDGRVVRLGHRPGAEELWEELVWHAKPGQEMLLPPRGFMTRLGHVIATADSVEELRGKLDACVDALVIEIAGE
jgi:biotin carboxylase